MDEIIINACDGKTKSQGGLNTKEFYEFARGKGYEGDIKRRDIIMYLLSSTGKFIVPMKSLPTSNYLLFDNITKDKPKLKRIFDKLPFTESIKHALHYSLDNNGHLKSSWLINKIGVLKNNTDFERIGYPIINSSSGYDGFRLISVMSLADECELGGYLRIDEYLISLRLTQSNQLRSLGVNDIADNFGYRVKELQKKSGCDTIAFGLSIPFHAMTMCIKGDELSIFDANDIRQARNWKEYWSLFTPHRKTSTIMLQFIQALVERDIIKTVAINNEFPIDMGMYEVDYTVTNIPIELSCPNFQSRTHNLETIGNRIIENNMPMFPVGFCLTWSYITMAMYMTYGNSAASKLNDFLSGNSKYYREYTEDDIELLNILIVHLLSVYLIEIVTAFQ